MKKRLELISNLPPEECAARLTAAIESVWPPAAAADGALGARAVSGFIEQGRIHLGHGHRSLEPSVVLTATMHPHERGTLILGHFHLPLSSGIALRVWLNAGVLFTAIAFLMSMWGTAQCFAQHQESRWWSLLAPMAFLISGSALLAFPHALTRHQPEELMEFLRGTLGGEERLPRAALATQPAH
jgi:hypothetical protein